MPSARAEPATVADFVAYLEAGCKPPDRFRIGTEHEKFVFRRGTLAPVPYEGEDGIRALLEALAERFGWMLVFEGERPIALNREGASITLEPAGQFELSGAPLANLHETCCEAARHLTELKAVAEDFRIGFLGMGFAPTWRREEMPWMPKARYAIMRRYMPKVGRLGLDMMTRTATIQANLDFSSEADMVLKFRVALAAQPILTALFADSPFLEGRPSGFLSYRSEVWRHTDPDRTGLPEFVFEEGFGFERYVEWALDVPMYLIKRGDQAIDCAGQSFRDFLAGRLPALPGERPTLEDFRLHLTTLFPEVRLKQYLEMRGADGGPWNRICALPAFWVGLLYDRQSLDAAWQLLRPLTAEDRVRLRKEVPRLALATPLRGRPLLAWAQELVGLAADGLARRGRRNAQGQDERIYLEPMIEFLEARQCPAERKLELYHGRWGGRLEPLFEEYAF
jgi:glutamate--cysteine ligase